MRIIGGTFRGRKFHPPARLPVRPTTDFAREALFNILHNRLDIESLRVLDLFAGTGSVTFEFASRGSNDITAVDSAAQCLQFIEKTVAEFGMEGIKTINMNVWDFIATDPKYPFDLIFADPPYAMEKLEELPAIILQGNLLKKGGLFVLEHGQNTDLKDHPSLLQQRKYGTSFFSIFEA